MPPKPRAEQVTFAQYGSYRYGVSTPEWKLIRTPVAESVELFNRVADPLEEINVAEQHPEVTRRLDDRISTWLAEQVPAEAPKESPTPELSEQEIKRLKTLGYL